MKMPLLMVALGIILLNILVLTMLESYPEANLALVALATGAGTAFALHVNDPGF